MKTIQELEKIDAQYKRKKPVFDQAVARLTIYGLPLMGKKDRNDLVKWLEGLKQMVINDYAGVTHGRFTATKHKVRKV